MLSKVDCLDETHNFSFWMGEHEDVEIFSDDGEID